MPYTVDSKDLPSYVKNKPEDVIKKWVSIFNKYYKSDGEAMAFSMANEYLKRQRKEKIVIRDIKFEVDKEQVIQRSIGGVEYFDFMLADNRYDNYGTKYSDSFLQNLTDYINENPDELAEGDFNHETLDKLSAEGYSRDAIKSKLKTLKKGVAKIVKAIYDKGKLYIRTLVNPRYKQRVMNSKGVSIEGSFVSEGDTFVDGKILGFSFIDSPTKEPGNPRARRLK